jgi:hypothetical protein
MSSYFIYKYTDNYLHQLLLLTALATIASIHPDISKIFWLIMAYIASSFLLLNEKKIQGLAYEKQWSKRV